MREPSLASGSDHVTSGARFVSAARSRVTDLEAVEILVRSLAIASLSEPTSP
jgi:hypothetical protein